MKYALLILAAIVVLVAINTFRDLRTEGVSGESTTLDDGFVVAEFGYARGGRTLLYAVFRSFPTNSTSDERASDPRYREADSGVLVRDDDGRMIPVGRDGMVYVYAGDKLRKIRVRASEDDIGIGSSQNMEEIWASLKRYEVHENGK